MNFREGLDKKIVESTWETMHNYLRIKGETEDLKDKEFMVALNANTVYVNVKPDGETRHICICDNAISAYNVCVELRKKVQNEEGFEIITPEDSIRSGIFTFKVV